ncbi:MAG: tRNA-uridine aminocarboxypropyltransferase [Anaeromyxobacter sp.]
MRERCPRCLRSPPFCPCATLPRVDTRTRVLLLQHPREARLAIGSAWLLKAGLARVESYRSVRFEGHERVRALCAEPGAVLLAPGGAPAAAVPPDAPQPLLVVVDATWPQAEKMARANPWMDALPRVSVDAGRPSGYGDLRREPAPGLLPTVEAVALALGAFDGQPERFDPMIAAFHRAVQLQLEHARGENRSPRHRPGAAARRAGRAKAG